MLHPVPPRRHRRVAAIHGGSTLLLVAAHLEENHELLILLLNDGAERSPLTSPSAMLAQRCVGVNETEPPN